jgi:soluble lytic murein transglycosylase-like protein
MQPLFARPSVWCRIATAALLVGCAAAPAGADIVRLSNGRTMSVESCQFDGDQVVLVMRGGGEVRAPRSLIAEILPDEIPQARTVAIEALAQSAAAARPPLAPAAIRTLVDRVAARVGLDRKLAHAVVRTESNYEPLAVSPRGAMGLMQIMPFIAQQYAVSDPFDPEQNLEAGMRHLRSLLGRLDIRRALAAYNAGEGAVSRYGGIPPYVETETYVRRILAALR